MGPFRRLTLLQLFSLISLVGVVAIGLGLGVLIGNAIEQSAITSARDQLADVIRSRVGYSTPNGMPALIDLPPAQFGQPHTAKDDYDQWNSRVLGVFQGLPIYLIKVWNTDSTIVWSDRADRIGEHHPEDTDLQAAITGEVEAEISNLSKAENVPERQDEESLLEVYVPVLQRGTFQVIGVFEVYEQIEDLTMEIEAARTATWQTIILGMGVLYLVLVGLVARASRTITRLQRLQELERYFSPAVARAIAAEGSRAGSASAVFSTGRRPNLSQRLLTRGEISVLFTDIRGFTRQSEQMDADAVVEMLNAYMDVVTTAVFHHNGSIDKFLGDGVLAVFGAPLPDEEHARDAVRAAREIRLGLQTLNETRVSAGQMPIVIGTAVTSGMAVTGNIGSEKQLSFTVTGDTVNLGSRLVGLAEPGEILISARTYDLISEDAALAAELRENHMRGPYTIPVRGREEPATLYVLGALPAALPRTEPAVASA
jgi:class 3 adenylate cyclase